MPGPWAVVNSLTSGGGGGGWVTSAPWIPPAYVINLQEKPRMSKLKWDALAVGTHCCTTPLGEHNGKLAPSLSRILLCASFFFGDFISVSFCCNNGKHECNSFSDFCEFFQWIMKLRVILGKPRDRDTGTQTRTRTYTRDTSTLKFKK